MGRGSLIFLNSKSGSEANVILIKTMSSYRYSKAGRNRLDLMRREKELTRKKQKLEAELLAVQSTKADDNPTTYLERCFEETNDVRWSY